MVAKWRRSWHCSGVFLGLGQEKFRADVAGAQRAQALIKASLFIWFSRNVHTWMTTVSRLLHLAAGDVGMPAVGRSF